jgi:hypothetical protein
MIHGELLNIVIVTTLLLLSVISVSTNTWQVDTINQQLPDGSNVTVENDAGLWKKCGIIIGPDGKPIPIPDNKSRKTLRDMYPLSKNYKCADMESDDVGTTTLTSMKILSIGGSVFLLLSLVLLMMSPSTKKFLIPLLIGGIMILVSITLWATDNKLKVANDPQTKDLNMKEHYGYSWYLGLLSGVLSVLFSLMVYFNVMA